MDAKPLRIAALLGEANGIGPEVMVRLLADAPLRADVAVLLIGARDVLRAGESVTGISLPLREIESVSAAIRAGEIGFLALDTLHARELSVGESTAVSGRATLTALDVATDAVLQNCAEGIVFAPMNKHALRLGGMTAEDEMRHIQARLNVQRFVCEFNVTQGLWTSRVTSHIPHKDVAAALTHDGIGEAVRIIHRSLVAAGIPRPRIGVCGLNPHAGDGGSIGMEEIELIAPAVAAVAKEGIDVNGPHPADTIFVAAKKGAFDGIVTMYHDQGQIAMKLMGFESGITVLGGLPVPITTCASGSAYDIAGKGIARPDGLREAFKTCVTMAQANARISTAVAV